jgi:outer membrane protein assembly factor BamB/orotate phosphoribosyltransferase
MVTKSELKSHLVSRAVILGEHSPAKSGRIMYDTREALLTGGHLHIVGELMWEKIQKYNPTIIYGNGVGSTILLVAVQIAAELAGTKLKTLIVRDSRKRTNRFRFVEGPHPSSEERAVFIDDLMNSGTTLTKTMNGLEDEGIILNTVAVCLLIDFWTFRGSRRMEVKGIPVESVFTRHDLGDTREDSDNPPVIKNLLWRNLSSNQWNNNWYNTEPLIVGNLVYFGNDKHEVYCHNLSTGSIVWNFKGPKPLTDKGLGVKLVENKGSLYFTSYDGSIYRLNSITGELIWKKHLDMFIHSVPFIDNERNQLYVATEGGIKNHRGDIVCLAMDNATTKWMYPTTEVNPASPRLIYDMVICGSNDKNLYSLNPDTGKLNWIVENIGELKGQVNYIDEIIVVTNQEGKIYGISLTGEILWCKPCGTKTPHQYLQVHRALGLVYVINQDGMVAAFDKLGTKIWIRRLRGPGAWNIKLVDDELITVTTKGHIDLICPETGVKLRSEKLGYEVYCPCDFNDKYIAVNSATNGFYVYGRNYD